MSEFHSAFYQKAKELIPDFLFNEIKSAAIPMSGATTRWKMSGPSIFEKLAIPELKPEKLKKLAEKELKEVLQRLNKIFQTARRAKEDTTSFAKAAAWVVQEMRDRKLSVNTKLDVVTAFIGKTEEEIAKNLQAEVERMFPVSDRGYNAGETLNMVAEQGEKFSQEQANYIPRSAQGYRTCGACRFFMRSADEVGACQVVAGPINWFATSDLFISAEAEASAVFSQAAQMVHDEMMDQALGVVKAFEGGDNQDNNTDPKKPKMTFVKELIKKRIRREDGKYVVTDDSGKKVLGRHDKRSDAIRQLAAIEAAKAKRKAEDDDVYTKTSHKDKAEKSQPTVGQVHQLGTKDEKRKFFQEIGKDDFCFEVPIEKINKKKQKIYGVVLEPEETDTQDDTINTEEIEKAAEGFMEHSRTIGLRHRKVAEGVTLTDSYVTQGATKLGERLLKVGTWIIGVKVTDPVIWKGVEAGEYTGFSVGGTGNRTKNV